MNNFISKSILLVIGILLSCYMVACSDDDHDPDIELSGDISHLLPSYSVDLSCSYGISNTYIHLDVTPRVCVDLDRWNLKIDQIDYYVDDAYCATKTVAPYEFYYESHEWTPGMHTVRGDVRISGKNIETLVLSCTDIIGLSSGGSTAADFYFINNDVTTGEEFYLEVGFNPERSSADVEINSIKASWDDESLGELTNPPYIFRHKVTEAAGTVHKISANISYTQGGVRKNMSYGFSTYEICGPTTMREDYHILSRYRDYSNGETLRGKAMVYKGSEVVGHQGLELYLDGVLIGEAKEFPYEHEYTFTNMSIGNHTLKKVWTRYDENWNKKSSASSDEVIMIQK